MNRPPFFTSRRYRERWFRSSPIRTVLMLAKLANSDGEAQACVLGIENRHPNLDHTPGRLQS